MKEINDDSARLPTELALVRHSANHPGCQKYRQGYLNGLIDARQLLAEQNGSLDATFSLVRR
jgi:hypothetical protein